MKYYHKHHMSYLSMVNADPKSNKGWSRSRDNQTVLWPKYNIYEQCPICNLHTIMHHHSHQHLHLDFLKLAQ